MPQSFLQFAKEYLTEAKRSQAEIDAERFEKKEAERRKKANREATAPKQINLEKRATVRPIAVPASEDMVQHKKDNESHPFWDGHLIQRQSDGSLKKSSTDIFEGLNLRHVKYTDTHDSHGIVGIESLPAYAKRADFHVGNGAVKTLEFRQHFMARLHGYSEDGTPLSDDRVRGISPEKIKAALHSIPREIQNQGIKQWHNQRGFIAKSKSTGLHFPVSLVDSKNVITINTVLNSKKDSDPKSIFMVESINEWEEYSDLPTFDVD